MTDTQSLTESLLDVVNGINSRTIMLPEFQRDFRWELDQTYDLFDSLVRDIFIGTVIYGKPAFAMTLREIDTRHRKGKGSNASLKTVDYTKEMIVKQAQTSNLRIVLDGQQRVTSIFRAMTGIDTVYIVLRPDLDVSKTGQQMLEEMLDYVAGEESKSAISVKLSDAYTAEINSLDDEDLNNWFSSSAFAQAQHKGVTDDVSKQYERAYRRVIKKIGDLYKQQKMVAYYLLDMDLDKFCLFFERSNSRGIQLNFTDILAAKLYHGFNLRKKIEEFESQSKFKLNREIIVRAIAYIVGMNSSGPVSIDKKFILEHWAYNDLVDTGFDSKCLFSNVSGLAYPRAECLLWRLYHTSTYSKIDWRASAREL